MPDPDAPPPGAVLPWRQASILERVADAFFALDASWRFTYVNARAADLLQQPAGALLGREVWSALPETLGSVFEREYRRAMAEQVPVSFEAYFRPLDLWVEVAAHPGPDGLSVFLRDIAARKRAEEELRRREQEFAALAEHAPDVIQRFDRELRFAYVNAATQRETGLPADAFLGRTHADPALGLAAPLVTQWQEELRHVFRTGQPREFVLEYTGPHGKRWYEARLAPEFDGSGQVGSVLAVTRDVSAQHRAELTLRESEERFRALSASSPVGIFQSDNEGWVTYVNPRLQEIWDAPEAEILGTGWTARIHPEDLPALLSGWRSALAARTEYELDYRLLLPDGRVRFVRGRSAPLRNAAGTVIGSVGTIWDITERKALEAELTFRANHDALTHLENRTRFRERVAASLASSRPPADRPYQPAVLFIDLDDFKHINDSLGHAFGDRLLMLVAERLRQATRASDAVARLGGDEFAILLTKVCGAEEAALAAQRILGSIHRPFVLNGRTLHVGASIGIALAQAGDSPEDVLRNADLAMYEAKRGGKGRYETFSPEMHAAALDQMLLRDELHRALESPELLLHYQPIVGLPSGRIIGAEALLRWRHPARGLIPPSVFVPLAEESGLILQLGRRVLHEACRFAASWPRAPHALAVTVNVSARQLKEPSFVAEVREALDGAGLPAASLVLEITESVLMHDREAMLARLLELKALGVQIAVDDFGTGFSSLAYLQKFPVDVLKIDKSFVDHVAEGGKDAALARMIVGLAESLGVRSVAEGVEHVDQQEHLELLGCRFAQGYLFARPMPAQSFESLLRSTAQAAAAASAERVPSLS